jgi:RNA polymerase sigma-70 factor (ECF subfamily)
MCHAVNGSFVSTAAVATSSYQRDPEVQLMLRVRNGDQTAFTQLVARYQDRLVGIFTNMFRDSALAEDLAQEVFLRIYRARNGYEPTAKFSTWVFQIANNLASNSRRTKGRKREVQFQPSMSGSQPLAAGEQLVADRSALMPTRRLDSEETRERVMAAMESLNERQRMAILLHKFEGMSYAEIGAIMELTPQAVKSLLSRARDHLRSILEGFIQ